MKRKLYDTLLNWKQTEKGAVALMIEGARRTGKSWLVENFAKNEYRSHIILDFTQVGDDIKNLFENHLDNLDTFFIYLQTLTGTKLYERNSVIVFDEVQFFPKARGAIKHLVADGRYDYLETGSLVSIKKNTKDILIPSEERQVKLYPMDFEEFLWALDDTLTMPFIANCFQKRIPLGPVHQKAMNLFRQYLIVGGMPQAVKRYVDEKNFVSVDRAKRDILNLYRNDIQHYSDKLTEKITNIWDNLPGQLQKHEKKFRLSSINSSARFRSYETSFFWLQEADIVNICYGATEPSIGLGMKMDNLTLKLYMADTGLLISHAFNERTIASEELYKKLLTDKLELNEGMFIENIVAQMLQASGHKLYFFSKYSKTDNSQNMEIDFLISKDVITSRHNIIPIEVKSSNGYRLASLTKCLQKYHSYLTSPIVIHSNDLKIEDGITYIPLYMTPLL
jgi:predicted AAA+ superfamily ATPase